MNYVWFDLIMIPIQVIIVFYTLYYFVLMVCGMWHKSDKTECPPKHSFAIIVCAHNESAVIGQLVNNLQVLDYPRHLYDIFVVQIIVKMTLLRLPVKLVLKCMNVLTQKKWVKDMPWAGCLTKYSPWNASMMHS